MGVIGICGSFRLCVFFTFFKEEEKFFIVLWKSLVDGRGSRGLGFGVRS